jgi:cytochrome c
VTINTIGKAFLLMAILLCVSDNYAAGGTPADDTHQNKRDIVKGGMIFPFIDPDRGRKLFVGKGCVICHSINGAGGRIGPPLDADPNQRFVDVFDFAARMWKGAPVMFVLQQMELGYEINFTGEELAQIAAFASNWRAQRAFSKDDIPEIIRDWITDANYERLEDLKEELFDFSD